ncbi:uncharacterized protein [Mytilus edulis]|uniref:uncharacterized protein isoform X1 n=1 Tax=Mytilus edulis TaxID=6550 RepID=UPI0039F02F93
MNENNDPPPPANNSVLLQQFGQFLQTIQPLLATQSSSASDALSIQSEVTQPERQSQIASQTESSKQSHPRQIFSPSRLRIPSARMNSSATLSLLRAESEDDFVQQSSMVSMVMPVLRRPKRTRAVAVEVKGKRRGRVITKDVVILPHTTSSHLDTYTMPTSNMITELAKRNMVGKITFSSVDKEDAVRSEINSLFGDFSFAYLQVMPGNKSLKKPFVSKSVRFDATTLITMSPQGRMYILALEPVPSASSIESDEDDKENNLDGIENHKAGEMECHEADRSTSVHRTCPAGHTLEGLGSNCLCCEQDREYAQVLAIDREIRRREEAERRQATEAAEAVELIRLRRQTRLLAEQTDSDHGFEIKIRTQEGVLSRKFLECQDIQVLMDFIGSQSSATEFFTVRGATMEMALESSLSGKPLSHFGITGPTVLNSVWMTESETADNGEQTFADTPTIGSASTIETMKEPRKIDDLIEACSLKLDPNISIISILREDAIDTLLVEVARFKPGSRLHIEFEAEDGCDGGGLLRELNSLVLKQWEKSSLSNASGSGFSINASALDNQDFQTLGRYVGSTVAQGTVGLPVFTEPLAKFIIKGSLGEVTKQHFETKEQQQLAEKVLNCKLDEIDDIVDRLSIGCSKPSSALCEADRKCWLRGLYRRDVLSMQLPALMDFQRGLQPFLSVWKSTPEAEEAALHFLSLDLIPKKNQNEFLELFKLNKYGACGSQLARQEDKAYVYFKSFLKDAFAGLALCKSESPRSDYEPAKEDLQISAEEVLRFFTGSTMEPPGGFYKPILIHFDPNFKSPKISTCALNATFPLDLKAQTRKAGERYCKWMVMGDGFGLSD